MARAAAKSWSEKLRDPRKQARVEPIEGPMLARWGPGTMLIPAPIEVDELIRRVRRRELVTIDDLRDALAKRHRVTITCPITTGIFALMSARAADEERGLGRTRIAPYWRVLRSGGEINPKYPGGLDAQRTLLEAEGHEVQVRGKRAFVLDFAAHRARL
ncbi:MAG: MGMT family protein [Planctomycetota bacterium]